jgi:branched-chain amino acid transport system permease protein
MIMSLLAIVIGGIGSLTGAIVGGLILGFLNSVIAYYLSYFSEVVLFLLVIFILLVRPQGLFGAPLK